MSGGGGVYVLELQTNATYFLVQFSFAVGGGPMTIDYGDGSALYSHATKFEKTYPTTATKTVKISCPDWSKLLTFSSNCFRLAQDFPNLERSTAMTSLVYQNNLPNSIPVWLSKLTALQTFSVANDTIPTYEAGALATQPALATAAVGPLSGLSKTAFSQILADMVDSLDLPGRVACTLTMTPQYNTTAASRILPTETDATNAATLIAAGWTVPNIAHPWFGMIGDSIDAATLTFMAGTTWNNAVAAAYNGGVNAIRNTAVASQGVLAGAWNFAWQVGYIGSGHELILIKLGTNDDNAGNMTTLQAAVESGLTTLKANNPDADIYWINVLPRWTDNTGGTEIDKSNIRTAVAAGCLAQSITCWDAYGEMGLLASETTDGTHLAAAGQTRLANYVKGKLGL